MTAEIEEVKCGLCGGSSFRVVYQSANNDAFEQIDFEPSTDKYGNFGRIVRCANCGHIYTNPRPKAASLLKGYEQVNDDLYFAESDSRCINAYMSLSTIKRFKAGGNLLEIGSSTGFFLNAARLNFNVSGLEISKWGADFTEQTLKIPVVRTPLEKADLPPNHYDVVVMIDVIEHLPDPKTAIKEIARILKPGGILYILTPDIKGFSSKILGRYWWGLRPAPLRSRRLSGRSGSSMTLRASSEAGRR